MVLWFPKRLRLYICNWRWYNWHNFYRFRKLIFLLMWYYYLYWIYFFCLLVYLILNYLLFSLVFNTNKLILLFLNWIRTLFTFCIWKPRNFICLKCIKTITGIFGIQQLIFINSFLSRQSLRWLILSLRINLRSDFFYIHRLAQLIVFSKWSICRLLHLQQCIRLCLLLHFHLCRFSLCWKFIVC